MTLVPHYPSDEPRRDRRTPDLDEIVDDILGPTTRSRSSGEPGVGGAAPHFCPTITTGSNGAASR